MAGCANGCHCAGKRAKGRRPSNSAMIDSSHSRRSGLRGIVRDVFVLLLAEGLVMALVWCLSAQGKAWLARVFGRASRAGENAATTTNTIDV